MPSVFNFKDNTELLSYTRIEGEFSGLSLHGRVKGQEEKDLLVLLRTYGEALTSQAIHCCGWLDVRRVMNVEHCAKLIKEFGFDRVKTAVELTVQRENYSTATVEGILRGTIDAKRKNPYARPGDDLPAKPRPKTYPLDDGTHSELTAAGWIKAKGLKGEIEEYFDFHGFDSKTLLRGCSLRLFRLKPEYR